jgi:hypothetical protein
MVQLLKYIIYFFYDIITSIIILSLLPFLQITRKFGVEHFPIQNRLFKWFGVFPIRNHYYEPKFIYDVAFDASKKRMLPFEIELKSQFVNLNLLNYKNEITVFCLDNNLLGYFLNNGNFGAGDAELYYLMIRNKKPKRIIEIGSGYSTQLCRLALEKNREEGAGCELTCIEPFEMPFLDTLQGLTVIRKQVESISIDLFKTLEASDILFIDSSHIIRPGNDLLFIYFQILPILQKGVLIHIHDIFTPRHYPHEWLTKKMRFWNEQYLLEAFLYNNEGFQILFTLNHLVKEDFEAASKTLIHLKEDSEPSSFWMEKR